jgi:CRISPR-associated protein Cmr5
MKNSEIERAKHIHRCLDRVPGDRLEKYSDRLKGAPAQVMDNGLLQSLAFFHSRGEAEYTFVAQHLHSWLKERDLVGGDDSLRALAELDSASYRRCSEEAIAWLNWAKRLAQARVVMSRTRTASREG